MIGRLPPLNACRAFEAAARLGSFSRAAEELNVTAGAVSHQVKVLEGWIGRQLFRRRTNNVVPDRRRTIARPGGQRSAGALGPGCRAPAGDRRCDATDGQRAARLRTEVADSSAAAFRRPLPGDRIAARHGLPRARLGPGGYRLGRALPRSRGRRERRCAGRDRGAAPRRSPAASRSHTDCQSGATVPARSPACPRRVAGLHASARAERAGRLGVCGLLRPGCAASTPRGPNKTVTPDEPKRRRRVGRGARPGGVHRGRPCRRPSGCPFRAAAVGIPFVVPLDRHAAVRSLGSRHFAPGCCTKRESSRPITARPITARPITAQKRESAPPPPARWRW